jgi:hypothetical protein
MTEPVDLAAKLAAMPAMPPLPQVVEPDADRLLRLVASALEPSDLSMIAQADYGWAFDEHLAALKEIIAKGVVQDFSNRPQEVLELTRWDRPPHEIAHEQRHWRRAFACAAILRALGEPENEGYIHGPNSSLAGLIDSLYALENLALSNAKRRLLGEINRAAAAFLAWLIPRIPQDSEVPFFGVGLLWFSLQTEATDEALLALCQWIMAAEGVAADWSGAFYQAHREKRWLLGTSYFDQYFDIWQALGAWLPERIGLGRRPDLGETVSLLGLMLYQA